MEDSHPNLPTFRSDPTAKRRTRVTAQRPNRLGQTLREARRESNLELEDLTEITNVRLSYLEALEAGRFAELPSDADGKNFVRRYARAVGLDPARALILYAQERRLATPEPAGLELLPTKSAAVSVPPQLRRVTRLLVSLLLVAAASWLALRAFDGVLTSTSAPGQTGPVQTKALTTPTKKAPATTVAATQTSAATPAMILLSLRTTPPGAEVSIDGYRFAQSPLSDAPVRAGNRVIKVERGGYGTFERTLDLSQDRHLNITLFPKGAGQPTVTGAAPAAARVATARTATANAAQVIVTVSAEAWLEVYRGNFRGGERLVYETAQPGTVYRFTAPVYLFSGNAGGVSVAQGDTPAQPLGAAGAVVGKAY